MEKMKILIKDRSLISSREIYKIIADPTRRSELENLIAQNKVILYSEETKLGSESQTRRSTDRLTSVFAV